MSVEISVLDRIVDRLVRTLSVGGPDQLRAPFTVAEITQSLVPYRTYRHELGVETLQDYEHAILELLAGERGWLICAPDTVAMVRKELASPDPDTGILHRLLKTEVRMGAIRMPVHQDVRHPIARIEDDVPDASPKMRSMSSDAVAIGDAMNLEDRDAAAAAERSTPTPIETPAILRAVARTVAEPVIAPPVSPEPSKEEPLPEAPPAMVAETARASVPADVSAPAAPTAPVTSETLPPLVIPAIAAAVASGTPSAPAGALHGSGGVTVANAATLSRITPLSVPTLYGDPLEFRGLRHAPVDVGGVIFLFGMIARELGFHVEAIMSGFPRCDAKRQIGSGKWQRLRIDFELESRHFREAGRNPGACDLLVCWRDTWPDRPRSLDVLALERVLPTLSSRE